MPLLLCVIVYIALVLSTSVMKILIRCEPFDFDFLSFWNYKKSIAVLYTSLGWELGMGFHPVNPAVGRMR